jgi:hypothetical protein
MAILGMNSQSSRDRANWGILCDSGYEITLACGLLIAGWMPDLENAWIVFT